MRLFLDRFGVFRGTEGKDEKEDVREKDETNLEAGAFLEGVAEFDCFINREEDCVAEGDEGNDEREGRRLTVGRAGSGDSAQEAEGERDTEGIDPEVDVDNAAVNIDVINRD